MEDKTVFLALAEEDIVDINVGCGGCCSYVVRGALYK